MEANGSMDHTPERPSVLRPLMVVGVPRGKAFLEPMAPPGDPPASAATPPLSASEQPLGEQAAEEPAPPPTLLIVDRQPDRPVAVTVETHSMSVSWSPVSVTVQSSEYQVVEFLVAYQLEMQQLDGDSSSAALPVIADDRWSVQYQGPATYVQVKGLRPGRRYAVRVVCRPVVTNDESVVLQLAPASEVLVLATPATLPDAPAPPGVASRMRNTIKFKWAEPEETGGRPILQYVLEVAPPPLGWDGPPNAEGWYQVYDGLERSYVLKRLQPGVRYTARVKAVSVMGESPYSAPTTTTTQATVPSTPGVPLAVQASQTSVTLQWEPAADNGAPISGYQLDMDDGRGNGFMPLHHGLTTSFTVGGLQSGVVYKFRVRAENSEGRSQWSPACEAVTAATVPSSPPPPALLGSNQSSISIAWKDVEFDGGSPVVGYEVEMQPKCKAAKRGMSDDWVLVFQGPGKACTLGNLRAGCTYRARVRAFNEQGPGPTSMPADVATAPAVPEAPASLAPTTRNQTGVVMAWAKPEHDGGSAVSSYRLEMCRVGRLEEVGGAAQLRTSGSVAGLDSHKGRGRVDEHFDAVYVGPDTSTELHGLEPGCQYQFRVLAINKQGASAWSQPVTVDTRPGLPCPPDPPDATAATSSTIHLSWQAPYGQGAPVASYTLQMCRLDELWRAQQAQQAAAHATTAAAAAVQRGEGEVGTAEPEQEHAVPAALPVGLPIPGLPLPAMVAAAAAAGGAVTEQQQQHREAAAVVAAGSGRGGEGEGGVGVQGPHPAGPASHSDEAASSSQAASVASGGQISHGEDGSGAQPGAVDAVYQQAYHGAELGHTVRGLQPDTEYAFRLRASNSVGPSSWSQTEVFRTAAAPPSVPTHLSLQGTSSSTSVGVSWQRPQHEHGSPLTGYQLEVALMVRASRGQQPHWKAAYSGPHNHCEVERLSPGREYQLRLRAGNACGWGPWTKPLMIATEPDVPEAPEAPTFSNRMGSSVRVKWQPPAEDNGAAVTEYVLEMRRGNDAGSSGSFSFQPIYAGEATSHRVQQLSPGTVYEFRVRAGNAVGPGPFSEVASVATSSAPPSPPTSLQAVLAGASADVSAAVAAAAGSSSGAPAVLVSWEPAVQGELQAACISYEIDATPAAAPTSSGKLSEAAQHHKQSSISAFAAVRQTCSAKVCQHVLTGLQPGAAYSVRVRGIGAGGAGHGDWSEPASIQLPALEKPYTAGVGGGSASGEDDGEPAAAQHNKRKKSRSGSSSELAGKMHRAQSIGTKTVAAKGKPKKTWATPLAAICGVSERELRYWLRILIAVFVLVVIFGLWFGLS